ncbi:sulfotransferase family protein [Mycobacterium sp. NPDC051804]|uniref:sulfotransferase family protein n=1 Tax=Mycobacterium sp. NPDC051804 TaxID=3364295 RepID=UPI00378E81C9
MSLAVATFCAGLRIRIVGVTLSPEQSEFLGRPIALFVLGMHRSGTSALTRVLTLCGGTLPTALLTADVANPSGYWEPRAAVDLNDTILQRHGSDWADPTLRLQEEGAFEAEERAACVAKICDFFTTLPTAPLVVIKDPRITVLSGMWFEAARLAGFEIAVAIAVRHPHEVTASITKVSGASSEPSADLASALWLTYNLLAERNTRQLPRVFVDYANFLDNWPREVERISAALSIDLASRDEAAIEEYLQPSLHRHRHHGPVTDLSGTDWISATYEALRAASRDEPVDETTFDRVFEQYRIKAHRFEVAFQDYRKLRNRVQRRRSVVRPINTMIALARRRRGPSRRS